METQSNQIKCERLTFDTNSKEPCVLYGIVLSDDGQFLSFQTAKRQYSIAKNRIISRQTTDFIFRKECPATPLNSSAEQEETK